MLIVGPETIFAQKSADAAIEKKIDRLLGKMTLKEKIGQMYQVSGPTRDAAAMQLIREGRVGSVLNVNNREDINRLQRLAVTETRLGIPLIVGRDVIHGYHTIFPIPLGQAATFDPELVKEGARVAAQEASSDGINWTFAPMLDIARDARWGRIAESFGEDPFLASVMGAAMVKGFQTERLSDKGTLAACAKHFIGYGAAEGGRDYNSTNIPERLMRNVYFPSFQAAVQAGAATVMTSFNDNDGVPSTANPFILKKVLRDEWHFDGFVVSDWTSPEEMINHGFAADRKEAALRSVNAGLDMEMVSKCYLNNLEELVKEGKVSISTIDNAVRNILRVKFRLGLFDHPYTDTPSTNPFYTDDNLAKAKKAAVESVVLLKNTNHLLPLTSAVKTVAVIGPLADAQHDQMGTWVFDGENGHTQTPLMAIRKMYGDRVNVLYEQGLAFCRDTNKSRFPQALEAAQKADVVFLFVGEESIMSGEAHSFSNLGFKGAQSELLQELKKSGKPIVMVVMAGRPMTIMKEVAAADATLYVWHPGTMGGPAIADLLFGKEVPSGKLPATFPKESGQIPFFYNHNNTGRPAPENVMTLDRIPLNAGQTSLGNTSYYLDSGNRPWLPFGFGLSYTDFAYGNLQLSSGSMKKTGYVTVSCDLTNNGTLDATEVVQLYVRDIAGSITRPVKELKGFQRIALRSGETKKISFELKAEDLAFYGIDNVKKVEPGDFLIFIGGDSDTKLCQKLIVTE
ncbi:glycoside hydrolase family 3 N-terminal domain-containing protein [Paludibacter jiangxiensis]|nr:glycoside hydrolase family 3 N-terminal domain-containing protein [Paludibacter jiangxiensis]